MTKGSRRARRWITAAVVVVAGGMWIADGASAISRRDFYNECNSGQQNTYMMEKCCQAAGGTFVVETYPDGLEIYKCTNIPEGDMPTYEAEQPDDSGSTWTNNVEQAPTTGTYEEAEAAPADGGSTATSDATEPESYTYERDYVPREDTTTTEERVPRNKAEWYE